MDMDWIWTQIGYGYGLDMDTDGYGLEWMGGSDIFSNHKPGLWFGFEQSLIPPGTDVHLQVNNTLIAATKKPSDPTARPPAPIYPMPKAPTTSTSVMHQTDATFYKNLYPALRSTADTTDDSDESDDDDKDSSSSDDDNDSQDAHGDQEVGWGAAYGHHSAHPKAQPSQPLVTTALPTDFEFQHSHDEDDNAAMKSLVADVTSSTDNASTPAETKDLKSKSKASCEGLKATQLGWYGPHWKSFLEYAKGECCVQHAIENPFPKFVDDLPGSVNEALMSLLVEWLEGGVWPDQKHDMAKLLYEDLSMWCSDLKKIVTSIAPSLYNLILPSDIPPQECAAWVEEAVTMLLEDSTFLHYGVDELGNTQNAAHLVLHEAVIAFFYTGSYCIAHRRPDIFQKQLPLECLALVCTAVKFFERHLERRNVRKPTTWLTPSLEELRKQQMSLENQPTPLPVNTAVILDKDTEPFHLFDASAVMHEEVVATKELNIEPAEIIALGHQLKGLHIHPPMSIPYVFRPSDPAIPILVEALGPMTSSDPDELLAAAVITPSPSPFTITDDQADDICSSNE
ncbi:hypothetical protein BDR07DRAFT_1487786 [Suillus spraguei]|nr:hypothetical protein BDR07DRAFT_1487786 [Suillus spraguei]